MTERKLMYSADLEPLLEGIERTDDEARTAARDALGSARGAYGRLGELAVWLAGVGGAFPPPLPARAVLVHLGDPPAADVARVAAGEPALRVRALSPAEESVAQALDRGAALADAEADAGTDLLLVAAPVPAARVPAAVLIAALTGNDAASVVGAAGLDDATWMRTCAAVRDGLRKARPHAADPVDLLTATGGSDLAFLAGLLLRAAARRTPAVLDGTAVLAAALLAAELDPDTADWWLLAQRDPDPASVEAVKSLGLTPLLDLGLRGRDGVAAVLAVPVLRAAAALLAAPG